MNLRKKGQKEQRHSNVPFLEVKLKHGTKSFSLVKLRYLKTKRVNQPKHMANQKANQE
jgi:hypothetical protein